MTPARKLAALAAATLTCGLLAVTGPAHADTSWGYSLTNDTSTSGPGSPGRSGR